MDQRRWILFLPQIPAAQSDLRVSIWRQMQQLGAVTLQHETWILPHMGEVEHALQGILENLETQGDGGFLFITQVLHPDLEQRLIELFRAECKEGYTEFLERCDQFMHELEKETNAQKFTFSELEENEEDWHKLHIWLQKIQARDFFKGTEYDGASERLSCCKKALQNYADQVYSQEGYDITKDLGDDKENLIGVQHS